MNIKNFPLIALDMILVDFPGLDDSNLLRKCIARMVACTLRLVLRAVKHPIARPPPTTAAVNREHTDFQSLCLEDIQLLKNGLAASVSAKKAQIGTMWELGQFPIHK